MTPGSELHKAIEAALRSPKEEDSEVQFVVLACDSRGKELGEIGVAACSLEALVGAKFEYLCTCQIYGKLKKSKKSDDVWKAVSIDELRHKYPVNLKIAYVETVSRKEQGKSDLNYSVLLTVDPKTHEVLFRTDRLDSGHPSIDAAYIQRHAIDAVTSGAYRDLRQLANADRDALLRAAAEEDNKRTAHVDEVAFRLHEAYASGTIPNVVAFLAQARYADRDGRAFGDRDALEKRLASIGVPCLPLLEGEGGIDTRSSISDVDRYLYDALPPNLRVCRRRVVVVFPERHVYPEDPEGMGHNLAEHLARKCRVFSETVAGAALADPTLLDDLDSVRLDPYKAFVKVDEPFLAKWRRENPGLASSCAPSVMFNAAAGFVSTADVSREAAEKRKAELGKVVAPGNFRLKNLDALKKEAFDYEGYLKPDDVWKWWRRLLFSARGCQA